MPRMSLRRATVAAALLAACCAPLAVALITGVSHPTIQTIGPTVPGYAIKYNPGNFGLSGDWVGGGIGVFYINYYFAGTFPSSSILACAHQCSITKAVPESQPGAGDGHGACNAFTFCGLAGDTNMTLSSAGSCALYTITSPLAIPGGSYVVPIFSYLSAAGLAIAPPAPPGPPAPPPHPNISPFVLGPPKPSPPHPPPSPNPPPSPHPPPSPSPPPPSPHPPPPRPSPPPAPPSPPLPRPSPPSPPTSPSPSPPSSSPTSTPTPSGNCGRTDTYMGVACCPPAGNACSYYIPDPNTCVAAAVSACANPIKGDGSGGGLTSQSGKYTMSLDAYGNLLLSAQPGVYYWKSNVYASMSYDPNRVLVLRDDANLILVENDQIVWSTGGLGMISNSAPFRLVMQNSGDLNILASNGTQQWSALVLQLLHRGQWGPQGLRPPFGPP